MVCNPLLLFYNRLCKKATLEQKLRKFHQKPALADHVLSVCSGQGRFAPAVFIFIVIVTTDACDHHNGKRHPTSCPEDDHSSRSCPHFRKRYRFGSHTLSNNCFDTLKFHMRTQTLYSPPLGYSEAQGDHRRNDFFFVLRRSSSLLRRQVRMTAMSFSSTGTCSNKQSIPSIS